LAQHITDEQRQRYNKRKKQYYAENSHYWRDRQYRKKYQLSIDDVQKMLDEQGHECALCYKHINLDNDSKRTGSKAHVDHCHYTGNIRAMLCFKCNAMLGDAYDDPKRLRAGAAYLEKHNAK